MSCLGRQTRPTCYEGIVKGELLFFFVFLFLGETTASFFA